MLTSTTCAAGSSFSVTLPANALIDVDSLALLFNNTISGLTAGKIGYRSATDLIQSIKVTINNNIVDFHDNFNQTCNFFAGYQGDPRKATAGLLSTSFAFPDATETSTNLTAYNDTGNLVDFHAIQAWQMLGFISSCQPRIIDTLKAGDVKIEFTLANSDVFATDGNVTGTPTFKFSEIRVECDILSFDSIYDEMVNKVLASGNPLSIPFSRYVWNIGSSQLLNNATMNVFVSSQSLDCVFATFFDDGTANSGQWKSKGFIKVDTNTLSTYFKRGHDNITHTEVKLNQVTYPAYGRVPTDSALIMALNALIGPDPNAGVSNKLDTYNEFKKVHYTLPIRLNYPTEDGSHTLSGVNTLGQNYQAQVTYYGGAGYIVPAVLLLSTSTLEIYQGRQVAVIN
jgi:hypothetical protein